MKAFRRTRDHHPSRVPCMGVLVLTLGLVHSGVGSAQPFSSGSTGADGALVLTSSTTLPLSPDGIFNFTTVTVQAGVTLTFTPNEANTPVTILATGDVTVAGTIAVNGTLGAFPSPIKTPGGPGGFSGGLGGRAPTAGTGPGGGPSAAVDLFGTNATYGLSPAFVSLVPLVGGSGGGGGLATPWGIGANGGSGGGAIVIASSTKITVTGVIAAGGGSGRQTGAGTSFNPGAGSGGAIRVVAPEVTVSGTLSARGGFGEPTSRRAGAGRIRIESVTGSTAGASITPSASVSTTLGPVTAASTPSTATLPSLTITSAGGTAAPALPTGSFNPADMPVPQGTTNPVPVLLTASRIPLGTTITVMVNRQLTSPVTVTSSPTTGTFTHSTATTQVNLPFGEVSQLLAFAEFTVSPQTAARWPVIDGDPVARILITAAYGEPSTVTVLTRSGQALSAGAGLARAEGHHDGVRGKQ